MEKPVEIAIKFLFQYNFELIPIIYKIYNACNVTTLIELGPWLWQGFLQGHVCKDHMSSIGSIHHVQVELPSKWMEHDGFFWSFCNQIYQLLNKPSIPLLGQFSFEKDDWSARPQVLAIHLRSQNHRLPNCTFTFPTSYVWLGWEYQVWYLDAPKGSKRWKHWKPKGGVPVRVAVLTPAYMRLLLYWKWLMHVTLWIGFVWKWGIRKFDV